MAETTRSIQNRRIRRLKHLDEEYETAEWVPNPDPRNLLNLIMSLSEERFKEITQLLRLTPKVNGKILREWLLEEEAVVTKDRDAHTEPSDKQGEGDQPAGFKKGKGQYCTGCKKHGHDEDTCPLLHPELSTKPRCTECGKVGHGKERCWKLHPELKAAWLQRVLEREGKVEEKGKGKGKGKGENKGKKTKENCSLKMVDWG
jgi:hypothetical protein